MTWYIGYAKSGHEFEVEEALQDKGIEAVVPRAVEIKKVGRARKREAVETPKLPNYVFINVRPEKYLDATHKHLAQTRYAVPSAYADKHLRPWFSYVAEEAHVARSTVEGQSVLCEFKPGDPVTVSHGLFQEFLSDIDMTFRRLVVESGSPVVEADGPLGKMMVPLADVRKAG